MITHTARACPDPGTPETVRMAEDYVGWPLSRHFDKGDLREITAGELVLYVRKDLA